VTRKPLSRRTLLLAGTAAVLLAGASTAGVAAAGGAFRDASAAPSGQCSAPALRGSVVDVSLTNMMNGRMQGSGWMTGGSMRLVTSTNHAAAGTVSFRVANIGTLVHELVVLPLPAGQTVGDRVPTSDGRVAETGSVGEASNTCASGTGTGLTPGTIGWVTLQLPPGHYELVCNLAGHYAAGMYAELIVS
jgi:uncharacterized cupredoxin-like copper-binding protein